MKNFIVLTFFISCTLVLLSQKGRLTGRAERNSQGSNTPQAPDYSDLKSWASHPQKHDVGDSIPSALKKSYSYDSTIDVFFIHPTTYIRKENGQMNADVSNEMLNKRTDNRTILNQATAFNEYRLFAPRYRQANYSTYLSFMGGYQQVFDTAYQDVKNAFKYFLDHWNKGQPFFIASHSQGSQHAVRLIKEMIEGTELEKKLIAAYIIGIPPIKNPGLKTTVCSGPEQTGCYVAWNTFTASSRNQFSFLGKSDLQTVNPLTWQTSETLAKSDLHQGAIVKDFNDIKKNALSARIKDGKLVVDSDTIELPGRMENLHVLDINLFYLDIRSNLQTRVNAYREKK